MDVQTIDQQYQQLQQQAQSTIGELSSLASKLQAAAQAGDQNAREWLLDLKSVALSVQSEQNQVALLLQALHNYVANQAQAAQQYMPQQPAGWGQQPQMPQQPMMQQPMMQQPGMQQPGMQQGGGLFGNLLNSGFARAIEGGAGFGIGDELIKSIF